MNWPVKSDRRLQRFDIVLPVKEVSLWAEVVNILGAEDNGLRVVRVRRAADPVTVGYDHAV